MQILKRIEQIADLWKIMLPHIDAPPPAWIGRWCVNDDAVVEHSIIRASKKFRAEQLPEKFAPETAWRYTSGVIINESLRGTIKTATVHENGASSTHG